MNMRKKIKKMKKQIKKLKAQRGRTIYVSDHTVDHLDRTNIRETTGGTGESWEQSVTMAEAVRLIEDPDE